MRVPHFLWPARGDCMPARLVALECDSALTDVPGTDVVQRETMTGWAGAGWTTDHHSKVRDWTGDGTDVASAWRAIDWALARGSVTWIVSHCAARVWGLLGLWELIERGDVLIVGKDVRDGDRNRTDSDMPGSPGHAAVAAPGRRQHGVAVLPGLRRDGRDGGVAKPLRSGRAGVAQGYAVLEDPPSVITATKRGMTGRLQIVDVRNYGVESWPADLTCAARARWLADVMRRMVNTLRANSLGSLRATAGSQAAYTHRRAFLTHAMFCHNEKEVLDLERSAYVGGRCECRRLGRMPAWVYHLDYRSLYASICAAQLLPAVLHDSGVGECPVDVDGDSSPTHCIAEVTLRTEEPAYPKRQGGLIVYPVGTWTAALCGPELWDAHERGRIVAWHRWARYLALPALQAYATGLYTLLEKARADGDKPIGEWIKRLLVGIVGKFGQRGKTWQPYPQAAPPRYWSEWYEANADNTMTRCRSLGRQCQWERVEDWSDHAIPAVAAWVCSAGRMRLLDAIRCAGWEEVYYHDTDSLITSERGYRRLLGAGRVRSDAMGELRLLGRHDACIIHGIKHYELDGAVKCSGLPRGTREQGPDDQHYWYRDWLGRAVSEGRRPDVRRLLRRVARSGVYRHGRVGPDGRVYPFIVGE